MPNTYRFGAGTHSPNAIPLWHLHATNCKSRPSQRDRYLLSRKCPQVQRIEQTVFESKRRPTAWKNKAIITALGRRGGNLVAASFSWIAELTPISDRIASDGFPALRIFCNCRSLCPMN
jgi:hypothetical protein